MHNIAELIKERRSVRTYNGRTLEVNTKEQLLAYAETIQNPFGIPVVLQLLDAKEDGLICPVVTGTDLYVGGKVTHTENGSLAFGYSFEEFVLYAQSLGLGTVWLGGTMNRAAFEQAMELGEDEIMPCASPLGYAAKKMSIRENMMRKAIKADERLPFEELFFEGSFDIALTKDKAGIFSEPLGMVRLAPSAANKQPWRAVIADRTAHFYLKRSKGVSHGGKLDMQMIDMGIALCHFALSAKEQGLNLVLVQDDPKLGSDAEAQYVASYRVV